MAHDDHLVLLRRGKESWTQWREVNADLLPDLSETDLRASDFKGWNFRGANLYKCDLGKCDFTDADLTGANLSEAVLFDSNLTRANLKSVIAIKANLIEALLDNSQLMLADFSMADLKKARFRSADLWSAKLNRCDLSNADFSMATLRHCDLRGAILEEANLTGTNLIDSDLRGADMRGAILNGANIRGVKYDRRIKFRGIQTDGCHGNRTFLRFAEDQDYLEELRSTHIGQVTFWFWWAVADCGRSFFRWMLVTALICAAFSAAFWYFDGPCHIASKSGCLAFNSIPGHVEISVRSLLGIDVGSMVGMPTIMRHLSMAESILGYVLLGGLVSIFANKLARRA